MEKIESKQFLGKKVTLLGTARDAKAGAVLITGDGAQIYINGLTEWSPDLLGKQISVKGVLKKEKIIPDPIIDRNGAISTGVQFVLKNADIK